MKLLATIILFNYFMGFNEFQGLIGKHISTVDHILANEFDNKLFGENIYYTRSGNIKKYYGMPYNILSIKTNKQNIVESVTIHINEVINKSFYDLFILDYGKPNTIQIIDNLGIKNESFNFKNGFIQHLKKGDFKTKEGKFEENPLFILWKNNTFQIKIFFKHQENKSEIIFSVATYESKKY